jgi:predicted ArsR family transcriptional regulator
MQVSKEWMLKPLESLGLKHLDTEVYVYLAQNYPQKARDIAEALETYKRQLYRSLKSLQRKGMVCATQERPARLSAVSFGRSPRPVQQSQQGRSQQHRGKQRKDSFYLALHDDGKL